MEDTVKTTTPAPAPAVAAITQNSLLRAGSDWTRELALDVHLLDLTGWDNESQYYKKKISRNEYEYRFAQSKVVVPRGLYFIWEDKSLNGRNL